MTTVRIPEDDHKGRTGWGRHEIAFNPPGHLRGYWLLGWDHVGKHSYPRTVAGPYGTREACQQDNPWAVEMA
jgi:hypothetical protein